MNPDSPALVSLVVPILYASHSSGHANGRNICKLDGKEVLFLLYKELWQNNKEKSHIAQ